MEFTINDDDEASYSDRMQSHLHGMTLQEWTVN